MELSGGESRSLSPKGEGAIPPLPFRAFVAERVTNASRLPSVAGRSVPQVASAFAHDATLLPEARRAALPAPHDRSFSEDV
jgi:hypothetical protein